MSNEPDRDRRERLERARLDLLDEQPEPGLPRRGADRPRGRRASSARRTTTSSTSASASGSTSSPRECDGAPRRDRAALGGGGRPALPRAARDRPRRRAPLPTSPRLFRAPELDTALSGRPDAAGARGDARAISGSTCARRRTSTSTSSSGPGKSPRAFCSPIEVPGQGDARDPADRRPRRLGRALPRGRPHRALREHLAPTCRWRRSGSATWPSPRAGRCCSSTSSTSRRG